MKFPYGICDFYKIITENYLYIDRTDRIPLLENAGNQLLFLRPRRFGKSLLLSMLENYYDLAKAGEFETLFGQLAIGKNPTELHNQYFVLKFDFSAVSLPGKTREAQQALHDHINGSIEQFIIHYRDVLGHEITLEPNNALRSFQSVLAAIEKTPYKLYLLIDEYDDSGYGVAMGSEFKALFKAMKAASAGRGLDRVFVTGVSPVMLSDTSSYNVIEHIYLQAEFNDLCGFQESEVAEMVKQIVEVCKFPAKRAAEVLTMMRAFYSGYCFSDNTTPVVYHPTLVLYFMKNFQRACQYPHKVLDSNLEVARRKITSISQLPNAKQVILDAMNKDTPLSIPELTDHFKGKDMVDAEKDTTFMASLLYYLGLLTLGGRNSYGELILDIPNLVTQDLYVERIQEMLLPDDKDRKEGQQAGQLFYRTGDMQPLCDFIEQHYFSTFNNRSFGWTNELTLKTAFITLLFNNLYYIMDSEIPSEQNSSTSAAARLTMIVRPDMRQYQLLDLLLKFTYIDVDLSKAEVHQLSIDEIRALPHVQKKFAEAKAELEAYRPFLDSRYGKNLQLHIYSVISLGFERLIWIRIW